MSQELTVYALFILLTVSMGAVFQFMLAKIKALDNNQKAIVKSISFVHGEVLKVRKNKTIDISNSPKGMPAHRAQVLRGDLTLEYEGSMAETRATFRIDKE